MVGKKIVCIFCGRKADIVVAEGDSDMMVVCKHCGRETELSAYRKDLDSWLDEIDRKA